MEAMTPKGIRLTIKTIRALFFIHFFVFAAAAICIAVVLIAAKVQGAPSIVVPQSTVLYASNGSKIGEEHHGGRRFWVELDEISPYLINATIAIEDKNFYDHHGFDFKRIAGAAVADLKAMAKVQGASTITQQYARNLYLGFEKTWARKMTEAFYTIRLEMNYSKEKILEGYLNTIYYGHGAYGVEAASRYYFGKKAKDLTLAEAALLAGIPKGPYSYSPMVNYDLSKKRQEMILQTMVKQGLITKKESELAAKEKLTFKTNENTKTEEFAPYFQDEVMKEVKEILQDHQLIETAGLKIFTTLDPNLQKIAESTVEKVMRKDSDIQVAFSAIDPKTGEVKALIGGRNYKESPFNRMTQAKRQPGSTIKPFLYYAALENGFTPSTTLKSEPTTFHFQNGTNTYSPGNYNGYYANDEITLIEALALSDNIYAVKTHMFIGMDQLIKMGKLFGIGENFKMVPSLALGTSPVRPLDLMNAYGILANGGQKIKPIFVRKIIDKNGKVLYEANVKKEQILNEQTAFITAHLMTGMFDRKLNSYTTVTGENIIDQLSRPFAGKSGTTKTDSWMIGFAPQLVAGVWTGYDKGKTIDMVEERAYSKKIWAGFMEEALKHEPVKQFKPPEGVVGVYVNPENGLLATKECPVSRLAYYVNGTEPTKYCMEHLDNMEEPKNSGRKKKDEPLWRRLMPWF